MGTIDFTPAQLKAVCAGVKPNGAGSSAAARASAEDFCLSTTRMNRVAAWYLDQVPSPSVLLPDRRAD